MNILFVLPYCNFSEIQDGPSTGFGIYTVQLAEELAKNQEVNVYVLSMKLHLQQDKVKNGVTYIGIADSKIALNALHIDGLKNTIHIIKNNYYRQNFIRKLLIAGYSAGKTGEIKEIVEKYAIDIIHIHSIAQELYGVFQLSFLNPKNTLVTIHSDFVNEEKFGEYRDYFRSTATTLFEKKIPISFVSSGVLEHFVKELGCRNENLYVTVNGTNITPSQNPIRTRGGKFEFVCIGTIGERKNQLFLLKVISELSFDIKRRIHFRFIGNDSTNGAFDKQIEYLDLTDTVENCGFVPHERIKDFMAEADGNILVSKTEAFGLSVIEGFQYGLPTLTYSDQPGVQDFYSEDAVMLVEDRSEAALARGIEHFIDKNWSASKIKEWGQTFQLSYVSKNYIEIYKAIGK